MVKSVKRFIFCLLVPTWVLFIAGALQAQTTKPPDRGVVPAGASASAPGPGTYYALVIGIDHYQHLPQLQTPLNDAQEVADTLKNLYGFKTELLTDATRDQIVEALDRYRRSLKDDDSLLIYYAGHGYYDKQEDQAYWAPVDATQDTYARWINAPTITGIAKATSARHVLIISDSCYSGMLTGGLRDVAPAVSTPSEHDIYLQRSAQRVSRQVLSSGGNEPVADTDAPGHFSNHSVFANALLHALPQFQSSFSGEELFVKLKVQVGGRAQQIPQYSAISYSGHDGGDFVFSRTSGTPTPLERSHEYVPPRTPPDDDKDAVSNALKMYEDAYASMDIRELKKIWPTLSKTQQNELRTAFNNAHAVKVELRNPVTAVDGNSATVECDQWLQYTYEGRRQPPQTDSVQILLTRNSNGQWLISDVRPK